MIDSARIMSGLLISILIGGLAYWRRSLTWSGWLGAILVGTITLGAGGWIWAVVLFAFFISSSVLSHYKEGIKARRAAEKFSKGGQRDFAQALANGGIGAALALLYGLLGEPAVLFAAFIGVMATVTADTWATELGVLSPHQPRLITNGKQVEPGTSGGVTPLGTTAAAVGGLFIGAMVVGSVAIGQMFSSSPTNLPWVVLLVALCGGLAGALIDSLLGATVQAIYLYPSGKETERPVGRDGTPNTFLRGWRWLNNDLVNLLSSVSGGVIAVVIFLLLGHSML